MHQLACACACVCVCGLVPKTAHHGSLFFVWTKPTLLLRTGVPLHNNRVEHNSVIIQLAACMASRTPRICVVGAVSVQAQGLARRRCTLLVRRRHRWQLGRCKQKQKVTTTQNTLMCSSHSSQQNHRTAHMAVVRQVGDE